MTLEKYIELLKKCHTLASAGAVFVDALLSEKLTNKQKDIFGEVYIQYAQQLTK
jgi:hypothetical protein